jgi:DNA (cytosine-5)-methyltransferase 1
MRYGSVCSGVEAASLAWEPLGWQPQWFSEIDKFPSAVLQHHWPDVPNLGDMTSNEFRNNATPVDLIVGGTPCTSFSVAGLRKGLDDQNGNLALEFCRLIDRATPRWFVWENVPGVLSSNKGKDFGSIVGAMAEIGYNVAWRILDAQHFGTPQRRRRIFLVGHIGADGREAAAVLFESHSLQGHSAPSREKGQNVAPIVTCGPPFSRTGAGTVETDAIVPVMQQHYSRMAAFGEYVDDGTGSTVKTRDYKDATDLICVNARETPVSASGKSLPLGAQDRGHAIGFIPKNSEKTRSIGEQEEMSPTLDSSAHAVAFATQQTPKGWDVETGTCPTLQVPSKSGGGQPHAVAIATPMQVRRLTPRECERLQGMPDDHTRIPWRNKPAEECPDTPRYKAIGNSMAVPVMRWIGERIQMVDELLNNHTNG